jgi:hypothetical protein
MNHDQARMCMSPAVFGYLMQVGRGIVIVGDHSERYLAIAASEYQGKPILQRL